MQLLWMVDVNVRPPNTFNKSEMFFYPKTQKMDFVENTKIIFVGFFLYICFKNNSVSSFQFIGKR